MTCKSSGLFDEVWIVVGAHTDWRALTKQKLLYHQEFVDMHRIALANEYLIIDAHRVHSVMDEEARPFVESVRALQHAGMPTFGMLCPIFPDVLVRGDLQPLVEAIRPDQCETVWAEPYSHALNWQTMRDPYRRDTEEFRWFKEAFARGGESEAWSECAVYAYKQLRELGERSGWLPKLKYLLHEANLTATNAAQVGDLTGVLLQSEPASDGLSQNAAVARLQRAAAR